VNHGPALSLRNEPPRVGKLPIASVAVPTLLSMESKASIGSRVRERVEASSPALSQRVVAEQVGMTPDALSRALNGTRAFSSLELARISDLLGADIHWLITGEPDPHRVLVAARHIFNHESRSHHNPGRDADETVLSAVALAYQQAYPEVEVSLPRLPSSASVMREALGEGFILPFAERIEERLDVDVVRVADLSTDYSFTVGGRHVVLLAAQPNWFRANWSLAHELGHLALGHHDVVVPDRQNWHEQAANAFAAELLLPEAMMRDQDWQQMAPVGLARLIWVHGVSTEAVRSRLQGLRLEHSEVVAAALGQSTQRLLRYNPEALTEPGSPLSGSGRFGFVRPSNLDPITPRMDEAAKRRFPLTLQEAHRKGIAEGRIGKGTFAWMLGVDADELEGIEDPPPPTPVSADDFASAMGL
jgi:transcriptional regulator with XRE-family HTH domain